MPKTKDKTPAPTPGQTAMGMPECAPCGATDPEIRVHTVIAGISMAVCVDYVSCGTRYRRGRTHAEYAAVLRVGVPV